MRVLALIEAAHCFALDGVLARYEAVVNLSSLPFGELPAEELLVEPADLSGVSSGYFEVN